MNNHHNHVSSHYDVVVIGGGSAGLSGALSLARSRRSVLVIDAGEPRNAPALGVHNFLTRDGTPPQTLLELGRQEVRSYGGEIVRGRVVSAQRQSDTTLSVTLDDASNVTTRRLLVATGLVDELPDVPGLAERWGHDVIHCPYCHGWEVRDQPVGILAGGPMSMHQTLLFRQLTSDLVFFRHTAAPLTDAQREELAALDVRVVDGRVVGLEVTDDRLTGIRLESGALVARTTLVVGPRMVARSEVLARLGLRPVAHPAGERVAGDGMGLTEVPGVWVAGNVSDLSATVVGAAAEGFMAGAAINGDLALEDMRLAVGARRALAPAA